MVGWDPRELPTLAKLLGLKSQSFTGLFFIFVPVRVGLGHCTILLKSHL